MEAYLHVRSLLDEALHRLDSLGETLIAAHVGTSIALLEDRRDSLGDPLGTAPGGSA